MRAADQLAREVVCAGFTGRTPDEAPLEALRALGIHAAILFARNAGSREEVKALVAALSGVLSDDDPALICVDQEGGQIARLRDGVVELPSMMALGATRDSSLARRAGARLGRDLRRLGVNLDFAPVLDLALEPRNTVIGARAFGEDPEDVGALGAAFARGLADGGVVAVGKHFPGHGATEVDSHEALPVLKLDEERWRERELVPFERAIRDARIPAVMTAHVVVPPLDPARPATLSRAVVTGILRDELRYDGVVFSDCLEMEAIAREYGTARAAPLALAAGADCIVISHRLELAREAIDAIAGAARDGALAMARLEEAAARMRRLRASIPGRPEATAPDPEIALEIARGAVTLLRGSFALAAGGALTVVSFEGSERPSLSAALRRRKIQSEIMRIALDPSDDDLELLENVLRGMPGRAIAIVVRRAHLHPAQARAVARILAAAPEAAVISAREPYDAALWPRAKTLACIYDDGEISLEGVADVMTGRAKASGSLPVRLEPAAVR
ncbi:MAG: beta-N-acetylhexosaminidase [Candidatus Eremiobacteraeota bacterium]|nr:beta-N-acetylhexosaminidase [Candidatus Eremiobacteraeota bacterium]